VLTGSIAWLRQYGVRGEALFGTVVILIAASIAAVIVNRVLRQLLLKVQPKLRLPSAMVLAATRLPNALLWTCAGLLILDVWGFDVAGLWTFLVSTVAVIGVGFIAVWTMVSNVTASLFISLWRPFRLGETVELLPERLAGRVVDRNLMFTVLRETEGVILQIPNNMFFQKIFRVTESREQHLFEFLDGDSAAPGARRTPSGEDTIVAAKPEKAQGR
jgi:small-conductance mechanosensitive channel